MSIISIICVALSAFLAGTVAGMWWMKFGQQSNGGKK